MGEIRDPSTGMGAAVDGDGNLRVASKTSPYLHWYAEHKEQGYIANFANVSFLTANANERVAHIKNDSSSHLLTIDEIRCQVADPGAAIPLYTTYVDLVTGLTFSAIGEGSAVVPVNLNLGSGNDADCTAYQENITVAGTAVQLDKVVVASEAPFLIGSQLAHGALMLGQNDAVAVRYESATNVAYIYVTLLFHFED